MSLRSRLAVTQSPALTGQRLVNQLRSLVDDAKRRLWIASPYIGAWKDVKKILGVAWKKVNVRLLVDKESGCLSRDTLGKFAAHQPLRSLPGLHAKLYIVDDCVLLTSANLTGYAFERRHEVGILVQGSTAQHLIACYDDLWQKAREVDIRDIAFPKRKHGTRDEPPGPSLPRLWKLPASSIPKGEFSRNRASYQHRDEKAAGRVEGSLKVSFNSSIVPILGLNPAQATPGEARNRILKGLDLPPMNIRGIKKISRLPGSRIQLVFRREDVATLWDRFQLGSRKQGLAVLSAAIEDSITRRLA